MTVNILRGKGKRKGAEPPDSIGEPDAHVFNCPKCSRPLSNGAPKCPGCGQRLILGVALRRASILTGFGLIIGVFAGAVLTSGVVSTLLSSAAAAVGVTVEGVLPSAAPSAVPTTAPVVTPAPVTEPTIPSAAVSALGQLALLDARISSDASDLLDAYLARSTADTARALRALASDAGNGTKQTTRLRAWTDAGDLAALRLAFYDRVERVALDALKLSLADRTEYRDAARTMLGVLREMPVLDEMSRALALSASVELPPVDYGKLAP